MTNNEKIEKIEATIKKLQDEIKELKAPKFNYPMWFKCILGSNQGIVVKFTDLNTGELVVDAPYHHCQYQIGKFKKWRKHTDTTVWKQVPEPIYPWQPKGGDYLIIDTGEVDKDTAIIEKEVSNGSRYKTKEQAEWASKQITKFKRLLAYVAEFDVDKNGVQWKADWNNFHQKKAYIYYNYDTKKWEYSPHFGFKGIEVYMSVPCAAKLVKKLNNKTFVL